MAKVNKKIDTIILLTSGEGEEQKCIGCHIFTSKKYSGPISYICPYTSTYPLIFTLFGQSFDQKKYILKSRLYMPQNCGVSKKSKTF